MAGVEYGVAKEANIIGVKVLGDNGGGTTTSVVAGVDWVNSVQTSAAKVANLSLGGGVSEAMASGNSQVDACTFSPARADNAYTVNAMQQGDIRSSFSFRNLHPDLRPRN